MFAVYLENAVLDGRFAETDFLQYLFAVREEVKVVEIGLVGAPKFRVFDSYFGFFVGFDTSALAVDIIRNINFAQILENDFSVNVGRDLEVGDMFFRAFQEINASENAGKSEFVLTFEVGRRAPFEHRDVNDVFSFFQVLGHVKFVRDVRDLRVTDLFFVDKQVKRAVDALKIDIILPVEVVYGKSPSVMVGRILFRHEGRIERERIS